MVSGDSKQHADGSGEARLPKPGEVLAGKYEIIAEQGRGGTGVVYEAFQRNLQRRVALKVLLPDWLQDRETRSRFEQEALAAIQLKSPHSARLFDIEQGPGGLPFLVMEFVDGADLGEVLRTDGPLPPKKACHYVRQACLAMSEAHGAGIIHRDLKPSNLILAKDDAHPDGELVKVVDFGISKITSGPRRESLATMPHISLGTPHYMSPEQVRSACDVDARSDVWALGIILYRLLSGRYPFEGRNITAVIAKIAADPPTPLSGDVSEMPEGLEALVMACLKKEAADRVPSAKELAKALEPYALGKVAKAWGDAQSLGGQAAAAVAGASEPRSADVRSSEPSLADGLEDWAPQSAPMHWERDSVASERTPSSAFGQSAWSASKKLGVAVVAIAATITLVLSQGTSKPPSAAAPSTRKTDSSPKRAAKEAPAQPAPASPGGSAATNSAPPTHKSASAPKASKEPPTAPVHAPVLRRPRTPKAPRRYPVHL